MRHTKFDCVLFVKFWGKTIISIFDFLITTNLGVYNIKATHINIIITTVNVINTKK
jgi:hypothetical protein